MLKGQNPTLRKGPLKPLKQTCSFDSSLVPLLGSSMINKIEKKLLNSFGANGL